MPKTDRSTPQPDQLWLSRPPCATVAYVRSVNVAVRPPRIEYALLESDGSTLAEVAGDLDHTWWRNFRLLVRREG